MPFVDGNRRFLVHLATALTLAKIRSTLAREHRLNQALQRALEHNREMERFFEECPDCGRRMIEMRAERGASGTSAAPAAIRHVRPFAEAASPPFGKDARGASDPRIDE